MYQTLYCQHQNDCVQLDSGQSRFKVSLTVRVSHKRLSINHGSVLMAEERPKRNRTSFMLLCVHRSYVRLIRDGGLDTVMHTNRSFLLPFPTVTARANSEWTASFPVPEERRSLLPEERLSLLPEERLSLLPEERLSPVPEERLSPVPEERLSPVPEERLFLLPEERLSLFVAYIMWVS